MSRAGFLCPSPHCFPSPLTRDERRVPRLRLCGWEVPPAGRTAPPLQDVLVGKRYGGNKLSSLGDLGDTAYYLLSAAHDRLDTVGYSGSPALTSSFLV